MTITAAAPGFVSATGTINVIDREELTVSVVPVNVAENAGTGAATGTVTRGNTSDLTQPLVVNLSSSDTRAATVPVTVVIAAGQASATFPINPVNDTFNDATQTAVISAEDAVVPVRYLAGSAVIHVTDDEHLVPPTSSVRLCRRTTPPRTSWSRGPAPPAAARR